MEEVTYSKTVSKKSSKDYQSSGESETISVTMAVDDTQNFTETLKICKDFVNKQFTDCTPVRIQGPTNNVTYDVPPIPEFNPSQEFHEDIYPVTPPVQPRPPTGYQQPQGNFATDKQIGFLFAVSKKQNINLRDLEDYVQGLGKRIDWKAKKTTLTRTEFQALTKHFGIK